MIKAQELRIGNIISSQSNLHKQVTVLQLFSDSYQADFGNGNRGAMMYSTSDGIPLTSEWLERFGFKSTSEGYWSDGNLEVGYTTTDENMQYEYLSVHSMTEMTYLKYVHQLQNLYFALTGSELQLKDKTV